MKRRISIRYVLLAAVAMFVLSDVGYADPLRITTQAGQAANTFTFRNEHPTETATDFHVVLLTPGPPVISGASFGGAPFPNLILVNPAITYIAGPGIPVGGLYTHAFVGWPVGTQFEVTFSYTINGQTVFMDPFVVITIASTAQGETIATPEPTTMLLLGTGLAGVAMKMRKTLKSRKTRQG